MKYKYTKEKVEKAVSENVSIAGVCRTLGMKSGGGNYKTLNSKIKEWDISIVHFTGKAWNQGENFKNFSKKFKMEDILVKDSQYKSTNNLKNRLYKEGYKIKKCEECGIEKWNDKEISLQLDHINGINNDNRIENLKILCPNCHSQTPTFAGKKLDKVNNIKDEEIIKQSNLSTSLTELLDLLKLKKKHSNIKKIKCRLEKLEITFNTMTVTRMEKKSYCKKCDIKISNNSDVCMKCSQISRRKPNRPSYKILLKEIEKSNYSAVGRKYGVSDNSIRNWIKSYEQNIK